MATKSRVWYMKYLMMKDIFVSPLFVERKKFAQGTNHSAILEDRKAVCLRNWWPNSFYIESFSFCIDSTYRRHIGDTWNVSHSIVRFDLQRIDFEMKALRWIFRTSTSNLQMIWVNMCWDPLTCLKIQQWTNWRRIITGDESWFSCEYYRDRFGIFADDNPSEIRNGTVANKKFKFDILWNPHGFHVVAILSSEQSFGSEWFVHSNLAPLMNASFQLERNPGRKDLSCILTMRFLTCQMWFKHFQPVSSEENISFPCSPDVAPSDYDRFGGVKRELVKRCFSDEQEHLMQSCSHAVMQSCSHAVMQSCKSWMPDRSLD
jgi:hypothetical protein